MRTALIAMLTASLLAGAATAGNYETFENQVAFGPTPAPEWAGFYLGAVAGTETGSITFDRVGIHPLSGNLSGAFAGANFQRWGFVFGGEGAYLGGNVHRVINGHHFTNRRFEHIFDLKARAGFQRGTTFAYGIIGKSFAVYKDRDGPHRWVTTTGINYGAGVEIRLNDHIFTGVEYLARQVSGINNIQTVHYFDINSIQIRFGWQF